MFQTIFIAEFKRLLYRSSAIFAVAYLGLLALERLVLPSLSSPGGTIPPGVVDVFMLGIVCFLGVYAGCAAFGSTAKPESSFLLVLPLHRLKLWTALSASGAASLGIVAIGAMLTRLPTELGGAGYILLGLSLYTVLFTVCVCASMVFQRTAYALGLGMAVLLIYLVPVTLWDVYLGGIPVDVRERFLMVSGIFVAVVHLALSAAFFNRTTARDTREISRNILIVVAIAILFPIATGVAIESEGFAALDGYRMATLDFRVSPDGKYLAVVERFRAQPVFGRIHFVDAQTGRRIKSEPFKGRYDDFWSSNPPGFITTGAGSVAEFFLEATSLSFVIPRLPSGARRMTDIVSAPWSGRSTIQIHHPDLPTRRMLIPAAHYLAVLADRVLVLGGKPGEVRVAEITESGIRDVIPPVPSAMTGRLEFIGSHVLATFVGKDRDRKAWFLDSPPREISYPSTDTRPWLLFDSHVYPKTEETYRKVLERFPIDTPGGWKAAMPYRMLWQAPFSIWSIVSLEHGSTLFRLHYNPELRVARLFALNTTLGNWKQFDEISMFARDVEFLTLERGSQPGMDTDFERGLAAYLNAEGSKAHPYLYDARRDKRIDLGALTIPEGKMASIVIDHFPGLKGVAVTISAGEPLASFVYDDAAGSISFRTKEMRGVGHLTLKGDRIVLNYSSRSASFVAADGTTRQLWPPVP